MSAGLGVAPEPAPDPRGAVCADCGQHMLVAAGCTVLAIRLRGQQHIRVFHGRERIPSGPGRCGDCGCQRGRLHHLGCDLEECPRCHGQLLTCGCADDPGDDEELADDTPW